MEEDLDFPALIQRVRSGDESAAAELVRRYEPAVRRAIRYRLSDARLRRVCDSLDVCQAVLGSFFIRAAAGQYDLDTPQQLQKLLVVMARNKVAKQVQREKAARRDQRRRSAQPLDQQQLADPEPSPSRQVAARELLQELYRRLSPEERRLAEMRNEGRDWAEIAAQLGASPEALRKRLARAVEMIAEQLGIDDLSDQ
jgi:RNA polymerase sigma-70 factor (ECF subfamily)